MALTSMTGFGRASGKGDGWRLEVECKSVNRSRLDVRLQLGARLRPLEREVRELARQHFRRGKIEVDAEFEVVPTAEGEDGDLLDDERFRAVCRELQELSERTATGPVTLDDILEFRSYFERREGPDAEEVADEVLEIVEEAFAELAEARRAEGEGLESDLLGYLGELESGLDDYRDRLPEELERLRGRISARVEEAMEDYDGRLPEEERLAQEIVFHVDKADVSEELQRASSHVEELRATIEEADVEEALGKEIDFYLQELVRETNTLSSKSHSSELTDLAISMKSTVEKMREQAANVE